MVRVIDKVIEIAEFASGIQGFHEACEALGFEKGKRLIGCSTSSREPEVPYHVRVARKVEKVDAFLSSLA